MHIILGSTSIHRQRILARAGYEFTVMAPDIDEKAIRSADANVLPLMIARAKASALIPQIAEPVLLITCDQVVVWKNEIREKPASAAEARRFLKSYAESPAQSNSAVVVTNTQTGKQVEGLDIAKIYFQEIPDTVIEQLIDEGGVLRTAGGFLIEDSTISPYLIRIEGDPGCAQGLPLGLMKRLLAECG